MIPLMQYAVMPLLTHAALYPPRAPQPTGGASGYAATLRIFLADQD